MFEELPSRSARKNEGATALNLFVGKGEQARRAGDVRRTAFDTSTQKTEAPQDRALLLVNVSIRGEPKMACLILNIINRQRR